MFYLFIFSLHILDSAAMVCYLKYISKLHNINYVLVSLVYDMIVVVYS